MEAEVEVERQVYAESPVAESDLDVAAALTAPNAAAFSGRALAPGVVSAVAIGDWLFQHVSVHHLGVRWYSVPIYATTNFVSSVTQSLSWMGADATGSRSAPLSRNLSQYMRPPDALLAYPDGSVLLLSEREADDVAARMWKLRLSADTRTAASGGAGVGASSTTGAPAVAPALMRLRFVHNAAAAGSRSARLTLSASAVGSQPPLLYRTLAALRLLAGETSFPAAQRAELARLIGSRLAAEAAEGLCAARDMRSLFDRSDLQEICRRAGATSSASAAGATATSSIGAAFASIRFASGAGSGSAAGGTGTSASGRR